MLARTVAPHRPPPSGERARSRTTTARRALFLAALVGNLVVLYAPSPPATPGAGAGVDKVVHAVVFAVLVFTGLRAGLRASWFVPVVVAHALISEIVQEALLAERHGDPWDALADAVGITLGVVAYRWRRRSLSDGTAAARS